MIHETHTASNPLPPAQFTERRSLLMRYLSPLCICIVSVCIYGAFLNQPPHTFAQNTQITVPAGSSVRSIAQTLKESGLIRSPILFQSAVKIRGVEKALKAGEYRFSTPQTTLTLVSVLASDTEQYHKTVRITIPEGSRVRDIASIVHSALPAIDAAAFEKRALGYEGYLFPETYEVPPDADDEFVLELLRTTFSKRTSTLPASSTRAWADIVTMASILEREGNTKENMKMIAGILWKRIDAGLLLQVDATLQYERGKGSGDLSLDDLLKDSPYNTYTRKGLPPTPISNPGSIALDAAQHPTPSSYFYYLTGKDGTFYYADTHEEHLRNKERYLR